MDKYDLKLIEEQAAKIERLNRELEDVVRAADVLDELLSLPEHSWGESDDERRLEARADIDAAREETK